MAAKVLVGTSGWLYAHWRHGVFYPPGLPPGRELEHYAASFSTVEINASFYRLPPESSFLAWASRVPRDFVFAVKASRFITHVKRLKDPEGPLALFLSRARLLGEKLGPVLFQLPPRFSPDEVRLGRFLSLLPPDLRAAFEFRDPRWLNPSVLKLLERSGVALCIPDGPGFPVLEAVTAPFVYVRMHAGCYDLHGAGYSTQALEKWAEKILAWRGLGLDVYVYFNNDSYGAAVRDAARLRSLLLGAVGGPEAGG
jgi:uncharacterized protein YecE (DUF72 family)